MGNKNEVFEYLIDQLRQQVNNNPYKQQCEDQAHEVQSLKNQLRDASAQIKELHLGLGKAIGDVEAYKLIRKGEQSGSRKEDTQGWPYSFYYVVTDGSAPSGCRKEDTQECEHDWCFYDGGALMMCRICGLKSPNRQKEDTQGCEHEWRVATFYGARVSPTYCRKCGLKK